MSKDRSTKRPSVERWQHLQNLPVHFPEPSEPASAPEFRASEHTAVVSSNEYPLLRVWLRDRDLPFKPVFDQGDVAMVIGKSDKTVRSRTRKRQIPFHRWPWGEVYYTAQDLEDLLASCEPGRGGVK